MTSDDLRRDNGNNDLTPKIVREIALLIETNQEASIKVGQILLQAS